jgi:hypothetical protein
MNPRKFFLLAGVGPMLGVFHDLGLLASWQTLGAPVVPSALLWRFIGCLWWGLTVPLGQRTLFGHLSAIGQSRESQDLVKGTKEKVGDLKKRIAGDEVAKVEKSEKAGVVAPQERLTKADRKEIRHFIDTARAKVAKTD